MNRFVAVLEDTMCPNATNKQVKGYHYRIVRMASGLCTLVQGASLISTS